MKIMVTGIGGIGGYIASFLCAYYDDVTLIARRGRKDSLLSKGLVLYSDFFGEHVAHPKVTDDPASCGVQDVIFVCVKNYSLPAALKAIIPCVDEHTLVVCMQNGVDHTAVARSILPVGKIMDSTIYINTEAAADYSIHQHGKFARMYISGSEGDDSKTLYELLDHPGLKIRYADDIRIEVWNKFITNCAINVITAYYEDTFAGVFARPQGKAEFHTLLEEAYRVGKAEGVNLADDLVETIYSRVTGQQNQDVTSSLAHDVMAHRPNELETFGGYLVRQAARLGLDIPLSKKFYEALKQRTAVDQRDAK